MFGAMRTVLIVNPEAGLGRCRREWPKIERALAAGGIRYELKVTQKRGDATGLAAEAPRKGAATVAAGGGAGTANEAANGFFYPDGVRGPPNHPQQPLRYV